MKDGKSGKKVYPHELIGEEVEVVASANQAYLGLRGKIVDETKMTIVIEQDGRKKTMLKNGIVFRLRRTQKLLHGAELLRRPEERLKGR